MACSSNTVHSSRDIRHVCQPLFDENCMGQRKTTGCHGDKERFSGRAAPQENQGDHTSRRINILFYNPFLSLLGNVAYTQIAKPQRDFATDYAWRYGTGCVVYLSALLNFAIYFVQVRNFRLFFIDLILCRPEDNNHLSDIVVSGEPAVIFKAKSGTHKREEEIIGIKYTNRTE